MPLTLVSPGGNGVGRAVLLLPILLPDSSSRSHVMITCQTECRFPFTMVASADNKPPPRCHISLVTSSLSVSRFEPAGSAVFAARTQRANFWHYAHLFASHDRVGIQTRRPI